jgi:hypothetical protein
LQALPDRSRAKDWVWPVGIALGLFLVILVNAAFIYIAVSDADEIVPSYAAEER